MSFMMKSRKGITPVIAIVLLLLITVGAVGVVYTQFSELTSGNDAVDEQQRQQQIQQASFRIIAVETPSDTEFNVTISNTGDNTINFDRLATLKYGPDGEQSQAVSVVADGGSPDGSCDWGVTAPGPGENTWCSVTNIQSSSPDLSMTDNAISETIELDIGDSTKETYNCNYDGSGVC